MLSACCPRGRPQVVGVDQLGMGIKRVVRSTTIMRRSVPVPQSVHVSLPFAGTPSMLSPNLDVAKALAPAPSDRLAERSTSATPTPPPSTK